MEDSFLRYVANDRKEQGRYRTLKQTLEPLAELFRGKRVLDFGASHGPAIFALLELGAAEVVGVEPGEEWVVIGNGYLETAGFGERAKLIHVADTRRLPMANASFDMVLVNAVLEHIPQPREAYIREIWRVLRPGGHLVVNETPNRYLPKDVHTTGLWLIPWLPSSIAYAYARARGRYPADGDWTSSGWRGLGYYELTAPLKGDFELIPEDVRPRHRLLTRLGIPASVLDPYPNWMIRKLGSPRAAKPSTASSVAHEVATAV
jgi:ubiquinone/menaquinone biosynthesis C-methylase UbiE